MEKSTIAMRKLAIYDQKRTEKLVPPHVSGGIRQPILLSVVLKSAYVTREFLMNRSVFQNYPPSKLTILIILACLPLEPNVLDIMDEFRK